MPFNDPALLNSFSGPSRDFLAREHNPDGTHAFGAPPVTHSVYLDGTTIKAKDLATGSTISSSTTDAGVVATACVTALVTASGNAVGHIRFGPGTFTRTTSVLVPVVAGNPGVAKGTPDPGRLWITGCGLGTKIKLTGSSSAFVRPNASANDDLACNTVIRDLLVDHNNTAIISAGRVIVYGLNGSNYAERLWYQGIDVRGVKTINVSHETVSTTINVSLYSYHRANGDVQTETVDCWVRDCEFAGNVGYVAIADSLAPAATRDTEHFHDNLIAQNIVMDHGAATSGTSASDAAIQFGSYGWGGRCLVDNVRSKNSWDVCVEVDGFRFALVRNVYSEDNLGPAVLLRNFHSSKPDYRSQVGIIENSKVRHTSAMNGVAPKYAAFSLNAAAALQYGHVAIRNCVYHSSATQLGQLVEGAAVSSLGPLSSLTVDGLWVTFDSLADTSGGTANPRLVALNTTQALARPTLRNIYVRFEGTTTNASMVPLLITTGSNNASNVIDLDYYGLFFDYNFTGSGIPNLVNVGASVLSGLSTQKGGIRRVVVTSYTGHASGVAVRVDSTAAVTVSPTLRVTECDFAVMPASGDVLVGSGNTAKVIYGDNIGAGGSLTVATDYTFRDGTRMSLGTSTGGKIGISTSEKVALHGVTPVIQRAGAAQVAAAVTAATNTTPFGYTTAAQADAIVTLLNEIRATLVEKGIMKGAA